MIRQLFTGLGGAVSMAVGAVFALSVEPAWASVMAGGVLVVAGAAAMSWAVGA